MCLCLSTVGDTFDGMAVVGVGVYMYLLLVGAGLRVASAFLTSSRYSSSVIS